MKFYIQNLVLTAQNFLSEEEGQDLVEYALVVGLIALGAVTTMNTFATTLGSAFTTVGNKLTSNV